MVATAIDKMRKANLTRTFTLSRRIALLVLAAVTVGAEQDHKKWNDYGGGPDSSHFVDLKQITRANVNQLQLAWTYPTQDRITLPVQSDHRGQCDVRAGPELTLWLRWMPSRVRRSGSTRICAASRTRGINYWESKDRKDRRLIFQIERLPSADRRPDREVDSDLRQSMAWSILREGLGRDPKSIARIQSETLRDAFSRI